MYIHTQSADRQTQTHTHTHANTHKQHGDSARGLSVYSCLPASTVHTRLLKLATTSKDKCGDYVIMVIRTAAFECPNIDLDTAIQIFDTENLNFKLPNSFQTSQL